MARVREFQCDMCSVHEKTTETLKPKTWSQLSERTGRLPGTVKKAVIVCSDCVAAIDKAATDLVTLVQVTIASRMSDETATLTERHVLTVVHKKASGDVDVLDPEMNEDEEDLEDEDEPPRKKRKAKKGHSDTHKYGTGPGAGD